VTKTINGTSQPWIELNNLYWNLLYEESFGSLMQSPLLGPTREFNGKLLRTFDAWADLYHASIDYQTVLTNVQMRSFEELMRQLVTLAEKGEPVRDWRQFQQLWGRVADEVFEKAFCSENNLKVRGRFLNTLNSYRIYQQDLTELWMKLMNLPSRGEIDEVHKNIYELRKEVKRLKTALAKYETQAEE
jgi:class III poly(R)-hydroxyalkanoic acid synthase PhaE subunit